MKLKEKLALEYATNSNNEHMESELSFLAGFNVAKKSILSNFNEEIINKSGEE